MTPKDHEEYVWSRWEEVRVLAFSNDKPYWVHSASTYLGSGPFRTKDEMWSAAYAFTLEREEQIRKVEEEIAQVAFEANMYASRAKQATGREVPAIRARAECWKRILAREQDALAELKRGMK